MNDLAILASYAHPDDEQGVTGTLARCAREGIRTGLICATRGEMGEIAHPDLATPDTLGAVREQEMRCAAEKAGIERLWFLDYRDSGMAGTAPNADPAAFMNAEAREAVGRIVRVIREFRPQVIVTFDETGGYGHPDHIAIYRWTTEAFTAAGDPARYPDAGAAWQPARLYYGSIPRSAIRRMIELARANNVNTAFAGMDPEKMGLPDEQITNLVDVAPFVDLKLASLECHATQLPADSPWRKMPPETQRAMRSKEAFVFAAGTPPPAGADPNDLFAGLRP